MARRRRIGIVGLGSLGQFLVDKLTHDPRAVTEFELAFVWNRSDDKLALVPEELRCSDLATVAAFHPDLIVEVCHPSIIAAHGVRFLAVADLYIGSPTCLADDALQSGLRAAAASSGRAAFVPCGALWGAGDIERLSARGGLSSLEVTMKKHPASLKLEGALGVAVQRLIDDGVTGETVLFEGSVKDLCPLAPNNVNTMAAAAVAAPNLGFTGVKARLVADPSLDTHVITIVARGFPNPDGSCFSVTTERVNPAPPGSVTGAATFGSFFSSMFAARGRGGGLFLC